ncbi:unnamed protein product [Arabis nemorensis]|uniref:Uncharacterized protein n=1 Tax=Arabis nemorensis TaxID=586526 RepID=A0A565AX20_9BRAS|nr:unnamed protein product [Arabis nemorensis]
MTSTPLRSDRSQEDTQKTSFIKLQVGLLGSGRTLQKYFDGLAENADTSTSAGLSYVLTEATLALLRHPDYCISCYSSVDVKPNIEAGEQQFNNLSIEERGKFDEETLVNVDSIKRRGSKIRTASGFTNEYIVCCTCSGNYLGGCRGCTSIAANKRKSGSEGSVTEARAIPRNKILAVEVLWTPQDENEVLSERELLEDYPLLKLF